MGRKIQHWDMTVTGTMVGCKLRFPKVGHGWGQIPTEERPLKKALLVGLALGAFLALLGLGGFVAWQML